MVRISLRSACSRASKNLSKNVRSLPGKWNRAEFVLRKCSSESLSLDSAAWRCVFSISSGETAGAFCLDALVRMSLRDENSNENNSWYHRYHSRRGSYRRIGRRNRSIDIYDLLLDVRDCCSLQQLQTVLHRSNLMIPLLTTHCEKCDKQYDN